MTCSTSLPGGNPGWRFTAGFYITRRAGDSSQCAHAGTFDHEKHVSECACLGKCAWEFRVCCGSSVEVYINDNERWNWLWNFSVL